MNIAGIEIGGAAPCRCVAEIGANHNGRLDLAIRLINAAQDAGADFVKFQCYTMPEILALRGTGQAPPPWERYTLPDLYAKAQTPLEWFPDLVAYCGAIGMPWFSSVFGEVSLWRLDSLGCPAYKVARLDNQRLHLIEAVNATGKPSLCSTDDMGSSLANFKGEWLYCPAGYPVDPSTVMLCNFPRTGYGRYLGLSSHCLAPELPVAAVARGAKLLEYHLQLEADPADLDGSFSLTERQFRAMVDRVRRTEEMLG